MELKNCITVLCKTMLFSNHLQNVLGLFLINKLPKYLIQSTYLPVTECGNISYLFTANTDTSKGKLFRR